MVVLGTNKRYTKALVLWTWGGNDIVSAIIVALKLQRQGIQTDIAGVLSPAVVHYFWWKSEKVINRIEWNVERIIPTKKGKQISFLDGKLPMITKNAWVHIENFYDFSTRYWTKKLAQGVNDLIQEKQYDLFVAVDVGWDILARWARDSTLLSPVMDFASLNLLKNISIDNLLVEFWLGTDGELRADGMREILKEVEEKWLLLWQSQLSESDPEIQKFKEIYNEISKTRIGHTATILQETLKHIGEKNDHLSPYFFISQIGNTKVEHHFDVTIPHESFGKMYTIQGKEFAQQREQTAFSFDNSLEQYIRLKTMQSDWKTELDLFYLRSGDNWTTTQRDGQCLQLLVPSTMMEKSKRASLIQTWIDMLSWWETDISLILKEDKNLINETGLLINDVGKFSLLSMDLNMSDAVKKTAREISDYQTMQ